MKVICNGNDLSEAVGKVIKAVSGRTGNVILEGIMLKAEPGVLILTATDTELTIEKSIAADVKIEGCTVVPGKYFDAFIKKLAKEQIELLLDETNRLRIKYGGSEGILQCHNPKDFPQTENLDNGCSFSLEAKELKDLVNKTVFSTGTDEARPMLKGTLLEIDEKTVTAVALDGYRLAKCIKEISDTAGSFSAIVPARCMTEIARVIDDNSEPVTLFIEKNYIKLDLGHLRIVSRLLSGDFVNYRRLIPTDYSSTIIVAREQLAAALDRAVLLSGAQMNNLVRLDIVGDTLSVSAGSEIGNMQEKIIIKLIGSDLSISFNARYFIEFLRYIDSDSVTIKFTSPISPCIAHPSNSENSPLYLVLPVRLKD